MSGTIAAPEKLASARAVLNRSGVRIMMVDGQFIIGVWPEMDRPEIREALRTLEVDHLRVRYLDGDGIPVRYKLRRAATPAH